MAEIDKINGFVPDTVPAVVESIKTDIKGIYGPEINLDDSSSDTNLIELIAQYSVDFQEKFAFILSQLNPNTAEGVYLDNVAKLMGLSRASGAPTTLTVMVEYPGPFDATKTAVFEEGDSLHDGSNDYLVSLLSPKTITIKQGETVELKFYNKVTGLIPSSKTDPITWHIRKVNGMSLTNIIVKSLKGEIVGSDAESDEAFRARLLRGSGVGGSTLTALTQSLLALPEISDVIIIENDGTKKEYFDLVTKEINSPRKDKISALNIEYERIPLHTLYIIIEISGAVRFDEIANVIRERKGDGVGLYNFTADTADSNGFPKIAFYPIGAPSLSKLFGYTQVKFQQASSIGVKCSISFSPKKSVTAQDNIAPDIEGLKEQLLLRYSTSNFFGTEIAASDIELVCNEYDNRFRFTVKELKSFWDNDSVNPREDAISDVDADRVLRPWFFCEKLVVSANTFTFTS